MSCATGCEARRGRATARGRSRPRSPRDRTNGEPCRSRRLATRLALALRGGFAGDDAIDPLLAGLLGHERQAELVAHHTGKEAAHRVRLPAGNLHDRSNGCSLPALEHLDHAVLLQTSLAGLGRLSRSFVPGVLATSRSDPAGTLVRSGFDPLLGFAGLLGLQLQSALVDLDGRKAALGDAQREWPVVLVTPPDRQ